MRKMLLRPFVFGAGNSQMVFRESRNSRKTAEAPNKRVTNATMEASTPCVVLRVLCKMALMAAAPAGPMRDATCQPIWLSAAFLPKTSPAAPTTNSNSGVSENSE